MKGRDTILLIVVVVVLAAVIKRIPHDLWWVAGILVFAGIEGMTFIARRRAPTPGGVIVTTVLAVLVSLAVRFL